MSMKKFIIGVREVHVQLYSEIAETEEDAITQIQNGGGTCVDDGLEYSHTLDSDHWSVEEEGDVLYEYEITHKLDGELEHTKWWATDATHAIEQWNDYVKDLAGVEFHGMIKHIENQKGL